MITFSELLGSLPACPGVKVIPLVLSSGSLSYEQSTAKNFVAPTLSTSAALTAPPAHPKVLVISAAGAVGKSTLAKSIAASKQAPLWDLARSGPIGQGSLQGAMLNAFGVSHLAALQSALSSGNAFLVIDALDEGRVKTNEAAFQAFLADVAQLAAAPNSPTFVLLGRTQVSELAWILLATLGVATTLYTIDPFNREQALWASPEFPDTTLSFL